MVENEGRASLKFTVLELNAQGFRVSLNWRYKKSKLATCGLILTQHCKLLERGILIACYMQYIV